MDTTRRRPPRHGNILAMLAVLLPALIGVIGLVIDAGLMMDQRRDLQHAVDAAVRTAATELRLKHSAAAAETAAIDAVQVAHEHADVEVTVHIPPITGPFAGDVDHVEVIAQSNYRLRLIQILGGARNRTLTARSVAGVRDATAGAAIVILDPQPKPITLASTATIVSALNLQLTDMVDDLDLGIVSALLHALHLDSRLNLLQSLIAAKLGTVTNILPAELAIPPLPALTAGFEIQGLGRLRVDGAILSNTEWGGLDERGLQVGINSPLPYGVACMPLLATTRVLARDVRVVGGVDSKANYQAYASGGDHPLQANRLAVPDPLAALPVPTTATPSKGHVVRVSLPLATINEVVNSALSPVAALLSLVGVSLSDIVGNLSNTVLNPTLSPGLYDSITVISLGEVRFQPGVYVVRGVNPGTNISVCLIGGFIKADGVMFYVTKSNGFNAATGSPDASENHTTAPPNLLGNVLPSVLIAPLLPGSSISGLSSPASPFNGLLLYQHRLDRRPIILSGLKLLGGGALSGIVYAKWGHVLFLGGLGTYDLRFACGTMRVLTVGDTTLAPTTKFPAARDVYLLE